MTKLRVLSCLALILSAAFATSGHAWEAVQKSGLEAFNEAFGGDEKRVTTQMCR